MKPPLVHLVDDDAPFLRATARMLRASGYEVSVHDSAQEFLDSLPGGSGGCVVTDLAMPGLDGLALQDSLARLGSILPLVFLSGHGDIPSTVAAIKHGAEDFLTKRAPREELLAAIDRALERHAVEVGKRRRFDVLSPREREVLQLVVQGRLNKQIAAELGIHERTVKLHRTAITTKLGVASVAELTTLCLEAGLFGSPPETCPKGQ